MRNLFMLFALISALPVLAAPALAAESALGNRPLVLCTTNAPPLSTPERTGMLDRILLEAFRRVGQPVRFSTTPSERGLINANSGLADGDANRIAGLSKAYPNLVQVPEPNLSYEFTAFANKPLPLKGWESLRGLRVGYLTGWKIFEENVQEANVTKVDTPQQLFTLLAMDRVDVALFDRLGGLHYLRELKLPEVKALEPPLARRDMYLYLNAAHAVLAPRLAAALKSMKADGSYAAIMAGFKRP